MLYFTYHKESCRCIRFSEQGNILYTTGVDRSLSIISNGKLEGQIKNAHKESINVLLPLQNSGGALIVSGDDDGLIKIWDLRIATTKLEKACIMKFNDHEGTIQDLQYSQQNQMLLSCSNDGHLSVYDIRKPKLFAMSDNFEEDLTSIALLKNGKKVAVSSGEGVINLFSWGDFGDCNDRILGHPNSIDCMIKFDEDLIITGSEDGQIRAVGVLPNKILGILSDPLEYSDNFHIQKLSLSKNQQFLASCSLDDIVRIIDMSNLHGRNKEQFDIDQYEKNIKMNPNGKKKQKKQDQEDEWESDYGESEESDSEMEDEEEKGGKINVKQSQKNIEQQKKKEFFNDL